MPKEKMKKPKIVKSKKPKKKRKNMNLAKVLPIQEGAA